MILETCEQERKEERPCECRNIQWNIDIKNVSGADNIGKEERRIRKSVV